MRLQVLRRADHVIARLGGPSAVARLTKRTRSAPCNWRAARRFPPQLYLVMMAALNAKGATAPPHLWGIEPGKLELLDAA